jgi:hypothetical protein
MSATVTDTPAVAADTFAAWEPHALATLSEWLLDFGWADTPHDAFAILKAQSDGESLMIPTRPLADLVTASS